MILGSEAVSAVSRGTGSPTRGNWVYRPVESRLNPCKRSVNAARTCTCVHLRLRDVCVSVAEPEPLISREEVVATMFIVADVAAEARLILRLLEEKGEEEEEQEGDR